MELELHPIQAEILMVLLFQTQASFSELNSTQLPTDHFSFHLRRLLQSGIIKKASKSYSLTEKGKEFANRFDTDSVVIEKQAKVGVLVCPVLNGKPQKYLVQQRLKQPYFGFSGFITGKIQWGETITDCALRELKEETGLVGQPTLVGVKHKLDYNPEGTLLEDKFFFVFRIDEVQGELITEFEGGKNIWMTRQEIDQIPDLFDGVAETIKMTLANTLVFSETKYQVAKY